MEVSPLHDRVLVVDDGARKDTGELTPMVVKSGDRVLFGQWSGTQVRIEAEDDLIIKESDILGIIQSECAAQKAA
jgi:chaperonin GroES